MTRDAVTRYQTAHVQRLRTWSDGVTTVDWENSQSHLYVTRFRGDLIISDHVKATPYRAYRFKREAASIDAPGSSGRGFRDGKLLSYSDRYVGQVPETASNWGMNEGQPWSVDFPAWVQGSARNNALSKVNSSAVNIGQFLGEIRENAGMLAGTAITVLRAYRAARRLQFGELARLLGVNRRRSESINSRLTRGGATAAGAWFSYQFGWKPLVQDVYNMHGSIIGALNRPKHASVKATTVTQHRVTKEDSQRHIVGGDFTKGCSVGISYRVSDPFIAGLNQLGLLNPALIAWELLPMSFVVDWFIPVSSFLERLSTPFGLEFVTGYETSFAYGKFSYKKASIGNSMVDFNVDTFGMDRKVLLTWPSPSLVFDFGLSRNQLVTLSGLLLQRL